MSTSGITSPPRPPPKEVVQDMPPREGYAPIDVRRNVPKSIASKAWWLLGGASLVMVTGLMNVVKWNQIRRGWGEELLYTRSCFIPYLQTEEDFSFVKRREEQLKEEAEIMKNRPDWEVGKNVYYTKDWVSPMQPVGRLHKN